MSNRLLRSAGTSGSTAAASSNVASVSGTWATKIQRQPKACTTGPPATTPITGAPAPTIDHQPIACARWLDENVRLMIASDAGPSAAPMAAPDRPAGDERGRVRRDCREPGEDAHAAEAVEVDAALAAQIGELARRRSEHGERQQRRRHDPRQRALVRVQVVGDPRDRVGQDRDREPDREQPEQRGREDDPRIARVRFDPLGDLVLEQQRPRDDLDLAGVLEGESSIVDNLAPLEIQAAACVAQRGTRHHRRSQD